MPHVPGYKAVKFGEENGVTKYAIADETTGQIVYDHYGHGSYDKNSM